MAAIEPRPDGPPIADGQGARVTLSSRLQLRSARGAGAGAVDDVSVEAGAVVVVDVVDVSVGAVLFSVLDGSVVVLVVVLLGIALVSVAAGAVCVVVVVLVVVADESVDCATAAPIPASRAAAAARADSFF